MEKPHIRWMIRRDMEDVLYIERESFAHPWEEEDFIRCLRQRNCIGMVAEVTVDAVIGDGQDFAIAGFMMYELERRAIHLLNLAVDPWWERRGVGRTMVEKLLTKLSPHRRRRLYLEVSERNLEAQLFFRSLGFRCVSIDRQPFEEIDDDAYVMEYLHGQASAAKNRIAHHWREAG